MTHPWDLFVDEVKNGAELRGIGALVLHADIAEGLYFVLRRAVSQREGAHGKIGEIRWSSLGNFETDVAQEWLTAFFSGPMAFFFFVRAKPGEAKMEACQRLVMHLERDARVPAGFDRHTCTLHLDIDDSDPKSILKDLRRNFGLLRAFKWDSKGSLLIQLSDLLLGIARTDRDGSLDALGPTPPEAQKRKKRLLEHARSTFSTLVAKRKMSAVMLLDECDRVTHCLLQM